MRTQGGNVDFWTVGAIQHLEAADAMLYVIYQHADGDVVANSPIVDLRMLNSTRFSRLSPA